jgi:hypothetical protein
MQKYLPVLILSYSFDPESERFAIRLRGSLEDDSTLALKLSNLRPCLPEAEAGWEATSPESASPIATAMPLPPGNLGLDPLGESATQQPRRATNPTANKVARRTATFKPRATLRDLSFVPASSPALLTLLLARFFWTCFI